MKISFHGATREVTGSCYLIQTEETRILIDCGMFQGGAFCEAKNAKEFDFDPSTIDAVVITHAHLDHTGRLPRLVKEGFKGPVYLTPPTGDLAKLVLKDAYQIMMEDFKREYRPPLYQEEHIEQALDQFKRLDYSRSVTIGDLSFRLRDDGQAAQQATKPAQKAKAEPPVTLPLSEDEQHKLANWELGLETKHTPEDIARARKTASALTSAALKAAVMDAIERYAKRAAA
jgi:metallo-beta-lactamase family protein